MAPLNNNGKERSTLLAPPSKIVIHEYDTGPSTEINPHDFVINASLNNAVVAARFGRKVEPEPAPTPTPPVVPAPATAASLVSAMPSSPPVPVQPTQEPPIRVTFEFAPVNGRKSGSLDAYYHGVVDADTHLALVYDHSRRDGLCYRPEADEEQALCLKIEGAPGRPATVHLCYATECRLPYGNLEFIVFTVEDTRRV